MTPKKIVPLIAAALLLVSCSLENAFAFRPTTKSFLLGGKSWLASVTDRDAQNNDDDPLCRQGPIINDWSKTRVPYLHVPPDQLPLPYGLNAKVVEENGKLQTFHKDGVVTSLVWAFGNSFVQPERRHDFPVGKWLNDRPSLGIALSGGGMRAASTCLGWLRGLNELGLLSKAQYVCSNSGATWVTMPLAAKQLLMKKENDTILDYEEYLGKYLEPEQIKGTDKELGIIGTILSDANILKDRVTQYDMNLTLANFTAWVESIDENFVQPMGLTPDRDLLLDMANAYLWNDPQAKRLDENTFPFPIFVATAYPDVKEPNIAVPFEFTPLYFGIPIDPHKLYNNPDLNCSGGYTQSFAFNTDVSNVNLPGCPSFSQPQYPLHLYQLPLPKKVVKAAEMTGISSSFFAAAQVETGWNLDRILRYIPFLPNFLKQFPNAESYKYWSPMDAKDSTQLEFCDGGLFDNTGVLGLLRRGCKTIIACVSSDSAVITGDPQTSFADIAALFGMAKDSGPKSKIGSPNMMQVFESSKWDDLLAQLKKKYNAGEPQVCKMNLEVTPNVHAGIYESGTVEVYFCVNGRCDEWSEKLGNDVSRIKDDMKEGWFGPFVGPESKLSIIFDLFKPTKMTNHFPYFSTFRVIYDRDVVNMMAHNCAYGIKTGLERLGFDAESLS